ncbi:sulfite exporter TauE/SafE family protein [Pseudoroseicyclus aestuarii]|uniref:Probable membrane transporter protein n=1 Tax=Pseudoroseicyclus aestuarii TaxID=1795041 RepID=A0A318T6A1_9RHOB|nr:sulfite exporter TauE/SafE family protein [Pseudoroseicyclus aestuarii]PYE83908.1 hypothetical protein DFP88_103269 [Pseudoroseicyclus aestuarii]
MMLGLGAGALALACLVGLVAGTVKGLVGFAMPMIMISGLSMILPPELALAGLILPTLASNGLQALRQGIGAAWATARRFGVYIAAMLVLLAISAQLVRVLDPDVLLLLIGAPITLFALLQIAGWRPRLARRDRRIEAGVGALAGFVGGMSGVWGPQLVAYLTALDLDKREMVRVQGVIYATASVALLAAHLQSGVLRAETAPLSALLVVPALAGMLLGARLQDRIDQALFRRVTLWVLLIAGLNLLRRALF